MIEDVQPEPLEVEAGDEDAFDAALMFELLATTPSRWVSEVRYLHDIATDTLGLYHFKGREFLLDITDCDAPVVTVMKSAQIGMTEVAINWGLHATICRGRDALTVLPKEDMIKAFSMGRIDRVFLQSPHLSKVPRATSNPKHKALLGRNWYFRASNSENELIEIPVQIIILDEYDRLNPKAPALARMRMQGCPQHLRREKNLSTPTIGGRGIDLEYQASSRGRWHIPCPHCREEQALTWDDNVVADEDEAIEPAWKCGRCGERWTEQERRDAISRGRWIHERPDLEAKVAGFHISALYSPTETAESIVTTWRRAMRDPDPSKRVEFVNQVLGLPYALETDQLTDEQVNAAMQVRRYSMAGSSPENIPVTMGVDQGRLRHYAWINEWEMDDETGLPKRPNVAALYEVNRWEDLDELLQRHHVDACVVDAQPDLEAAKAFQYRNLGCVWLSATWIDRGTQMMEWRAFDDDDEIVGPLGLTGGYCKIHKAMIIDQLFGRFRRSRGILLPSDFPIEARRHLLALYVEMGEDRWGNPVKRWTAGGKPDHFADAACYADAAAARLADGWVAPIPEERDAGWDEDTTGAFP